MAVRVSPLPPSSTERKKNSLHHDEFQSIPSAESSIHHHGAHQTRKRKPLWIHCAVVMPDRVHILFSPRLDENCEAYSTAEILYGIRGPSAHKINRLLIRSGRLWQDEYFDRLVREGEFSEYVDYVCRNPERAELVIREEDYPWLWIYREV